MKERLRLSYTLSAPDKKGEEILEREFLKGQETGWLEIFSIDIVRGFIIRFSFGAGEAADEKEGECIIM